MRGNNNVSRGVDMSAQSGRAMGRATIWIFLMGLIAAIVAAAWELKIHIDPAAWPWLLAMAEAVGLNIVNFHGHSLTLPNGVVVNSDAWLHGVGPIELNRLSPIGIHAAWIGAAWGCGMFLLLIGLAWWRGRKWGSSRFVRGGKLVSARKLWWMLTWRFKASDIRVGSIPLAKNAEIQHLLLSGSPGSGKSVGFSQILDSVAKRGQRAVIYDKKGDFVKHFFNPERGDILLNPLDARCPIWDPWGEARHAADFDRIAASIIPPGQGEGTYWHDTARSLLSNAMFKMWDDPDRDVPTLLRIVLNGSLQELAALVSDTDAQILLSEKNQKTADGVRSTLNTYLRALRFLPRPRPGEAVFSMRDWVENEDNHGWIFITSNASLHKSLRPLISCWCDCLMASMLSMKTSRSRRVFLALDELPSLQQLESLSPALGEGRGYGLAVVAGIQNPPQLRARYGRDEAESIVGMCSTQLHYRANDPDTAQWVSRCLGSEDVEDRLESVSYGGGHARSGVNSSVHRHERPLVTPTEIMRMDDLDAYVKLAGSWPIAKTKLRFKKRPEIAEPFLPASEPERQESHMAELAKAEGEQAMSLGVSDADGAEDDDERMM